MWTVVRTEFTVKENGLQGIKKQQQQHTPLKKVEYEIQHAILVEVLNYVLYCLISLSVLKQTIIVNHYTEFTIISSS